MALLLSLICIVLAALCNAVMDVTETEIAFNASKLKTLNKKFWCKPISAHSLGFLPFTQYRADAWHLAKSLMLFFLCAGAVKYVPLYGQLIDFVILGFTWCGSFNLSYHFLKPKIN